MNDLEFTFDELNAIQKQYAISSMYYALRDGIGFNLDKHWIDEELIISIIEKLGTTFDDIGMIAKLSRSNRRLTVVILERLNNECKETRKG